jgi:hypothetical protein
MRVKLTADPSRIVWTEWRLEAVMARSSGFQPRRACPPEPNALKDWQCEYEDMIYLS